MHSPDKIGSISYPKHKNRTGIEKVIMLNHHPTYRRQIKNFEKKSESFLPAKIAKILGSTFFFFLGSLAHETPSDRKLVDKAWYVTTRHISKKQLPLFCAFFHEKNSKKDLKMFSKVQFEPRRRPEISAAPAKNSKQHSSTTI